MNEDHKIIQKSYPYIDALRGMAVLGVLLIHCKGSQVDLQSSLLNSIVNQGAYGVQLFYIISAFTLFTSLSNRASYEKNVFVNFFIRRFFRIAPLYYLAIIYYILQDGLGERYWLGDAKNISAFNIAANFTFTHGFNPYWINSLVPGGWSIAVEMTFYLIVPFLFLKIKNINHAIYFLIGSLLISNTIIYFLKSHPLIASTRLWNEYMYFFFPSQLPIFCLGLVLYFIISDTIEYSHKIISAKSFLLIAAYLILSYSSGLAFIEIPVHFKFSVALCVFIYTLHLKEYKLFVNKLTVYIGKISFSMYINHFAVLYIINQFDLFESSISGFVAKFVLVTILSIGISSITYALIEQKGNWMGKKLINYIGIKGRQKGNISVPI